MLEAHAAGTLFTVSAPSGAGKTSLVKALIESDANLMVSVSHTTRSQRESELEGVDYHFVSPSQFDAMVSDLAFLEYAEVFGNSYGTSKAWVLQQLHSGKDVVLEIDWQGAEQVRNWALGEGHAIFCSIFILPPSLDTLRARLTDRGQDRSDVIEARMQAAVAEISHFDAADYLVLNDDFEQALAELKAIISAQRLRIEAQKARHHQTIGAMLR